MEDEMRRIARNAALVFAAGTFAVMTTSAYAGCKSFGAVGTGINQDVAKYMADAALKNIRINAGFPNASGATTYKCEAGMIATDCHAHQKACQ
jgi:hypothetical protein